MTLEEFEKQYAEAMKAMRESRKMALERAGVKPKEPVYTTFKATLDLNEVDEKLKRFIVLRNELVMLAEEIGIEVRDNVLEFKPE